MINKNKYSIKSRTLLFILAAIFGLFIPMNVQAVTPVYSVSNLELNTILNKEDQIYMNTGDSITFTYKLGSDVYMRHKQTGSPVVFNGFNGISKWRIDIVSFSPSPDIAYGMDYYFTLVPFDEPAKDIDITKDDSTKDDTGSECHHDYEWDEIRKATPTASGLKYYKCIKCGYVESVLETSGFQAFLEDAVSRIAAAPPDGEVNLDTKMWVSFNSSVIDALTARPDITLHISYRYEGKYYTVTIPPNADLTNLLNEEGYCGFRYLDAVFGGLEIAG